ncbi:MAG TPA: DNA-formamidopyrimidine glycosylase family protein [Chthoniobacterales bacterium]|jgi:formamidopyrimidine-DNA glycosylase
MPELAEVEYFRKRWDPGIGARIVALQLHHAKRIFRGSDVRELERHLVRQKLLRSTARGKQMLFVFSDDNWLGIHLGMSGNLRVEPTDFEAEKHDHLVLQQEKRALVFRDARQFGRVRFHHGRDAPDWWSNWAVDIQAPTYRLRVMCEFVRRHARAPIKAVLLLQSGFPGVGNWMADEILWRAEVAPQRKAGTLSADELAALWRNVRFVARAALRTIGKDNSEPPRTWLLHERWHADGKCPRHRTKLRRATVGGRTTAWCPRCQH